MTFPIGKTRVCSHFLISIYHFYFSSHTFIDLSIGGGAASLSWHANLAEASCPPLQFPLFCLLCLDPIDQNLPFQVVTDRNFGSLPWAFTSFHRKKKVRNEGEEKNRKKWLKREGERSREMEQNR
jgi:hypothetical protein